MLISNKHVQNNRKFKFLIIEDDLANQIALQIILKAKFNCEVCSANTGEEAIAIANDQLFNLIFMNIGLPGIDGISAAKIIRQSGGVNKHTPIIATSGILYEEKLCSEAGINAFLAKPFSISEFDKVIKKVRLRAI